MNKIRIGKKRGQVWVETVLYTLIGLVLIGLVLAFASPRISEAKDRLVVEQSINSLNAFDEKVNIDPGNVRRIDFTIKRGALYIDPEKDLIRLEINDLSKPYSEPGVLINYGRVSGISETEQKFSKIALYLNYSKQFNITYNGKKTEMKFDSAATPYIFLISNLGAENGIEKIDIVESG